MLALLEKWFQDRQSTVFFKLALHLWSLPQPTELLSNPIFRLGQLTPLILHRLMPVWTLLIKPEFLFGPYICYSAEEEKRKRTASEYGCRGEEYIFPNIDDPTTREMALNYLFAVFGVWWEKSCCEFCPFQAEENAIARYLREPKALAFAMYMESVAVAFNPRMYQFGFGSAYGLAERSGNTEAQRLFWEHWNGVEKWALYHVRRITWFKEKKKKPGEYREDSNRCIRIAAIGSRQDVEAEFQLLLRQPGAELSHQETVWFNKGKARHNLNDQRTKFAVRPIDRIYLRYRGDNYPKIEEFFVAATAVVKEKVRNAKKFEDEWHQWAICGGQEATQDNLFEMELVES